MSEHEIPFKQWVAEEAERRGRCTETIRRWLKCGKLGELKLRQVNRRVIFVINDQDEPRRSSEPIPAPSGLSDAFDDPSYQQFMQEMAAHCHCNAPFDRPCAGLLAGGLCDDLGNARTE